MRVFSLLATLLLAVPAAPTAAQTAADSAAIRAAALDYVEGWYAADPARMERALHPDLAKRIVRQDPQGRWRLDHMGALALVQNVRAGGGSRTPPDQRRRDVTILDVIGNAASVKAVMSGWVDYLHIVRWGERWVIVNVLWELTPDPR